MIRLNSECSRPVSVRADFHRGLDESTAATGNRLFARGESGAARAARRSPTSFHGRPAAPARGASQRARPTRAVADHNDRHPWDAAGLAPKADRSKVRWERQPWSWPTAHGRRHRITGGANGCREPCLGLHAHCWCTVESGPQSGTRHCGQHSEAQWHRTGTGAQPQNNLEGVSGTTLGNDRCSGLLHHRGLDGQRTAALSRSLFYRVVTARQPSGFGQPTDFPRRRRCRQCRRYPATRTIGRHAQLLLPGRRLSHLPPHPVVPTKNAKQARDGNGQSFAIVVRPVQPFLDWLHRVDPTSAQLTLEDLRREPTIYLLPEWETEDEALEHLAEVSSEIFKEQLNGWYRVPSVWPEDRELNAFLRWFDCSFHSMVFDVCDERLRHTNT